MFVKVVHVVRILVLPPSDEISQHFNNINVTRFSILGVLPWLQNAAVPWLERKLCLFLWFICCCRRLVKARDVIKETKHTLSSY